MWLPSDYKTKFNEFNLIVWLVQLYGKFTNSYRFIAVSFSPISLWSFTRAYQLSRNNAERINSKTWYRETWLLFVDERLLKRHIRMHVRSRCFQPVRCLRYQTGWNAESVNNYGSLCCCIVIHNRYSINVDAWLQAIDRCLGKSGLCAFEGFVRWGIFDSLISPINSQGCLFAVSAKHLSKTFNELTAVNWWFMPLHGLRCTLSSLRRWRCLDERRFNFMPRLIDLCKSWTSSLFSIWLTKRISERWKISTKEKFCIIR